MPERSRGGGPPRSQRPPPRGKRPAPPLRDGPRAAAGAARPAAPAARLKSRAPSFQRVEALPEPVLPRPARAPRPVPALPAGPLRVPISTIDWLVSRESPPARFLALRDLLARPAKDLELRKARLALKSDRFFRDAVSRLRNRLSPGWRPEDLAAKYDGGYWQTLFLAEMGADRSLPEMKHAADVLFARWERAFFDIERDESGALDLGLLSLVCRTLALLGYAEDARVLAGAEHVARRRVVEGGDPAARVATLGKDLLLFAAIPESRRSPILARGIDFLTERAVQSALPKERGRSGGDEERFGFPVADLPDLLELMDGLARVGTARRPELEPALAVVAAKADHRARWSLEKTLPGVALSPERPGELSRLVTIRALGVMQRFVGLRVESK